ncbi:MAG TPA: hypothetical protein VF958_05685, partial [Thermoanaerobaculia bacterium]
MTRFDVARRTALVQDLLAQARGRPTDLLPFDAVREKFRLRRLVDRGIQEVPLERIAGTVQREREFNRAFLPRDESLRDRWQEIEGLAEGAKGFPPVELYRVGETDFVVDGHHRVSVARSLGASTIEAHVKEFETAVPLDPTSSIEDVVLKEGLSDFLETTGLSPERPDEFRTTEANGYERLIDHINVHRHFRGVNERREIPWPEAVRSWRDTVYRPMIERIETSGVLEEFPGRTPTDLYLFTMD